MSAAFNEMAALRREVQALRCKVPCDGRHSNQGQRRMASRVLKLIDAHLEALDRVGCESEDQIAEELRA